MDCSRIEYACGVDRLGRKRIHEQSAQRAAEPFVRWNVESRFLAVKHEIWQLAPHQFLQDELLLEASDLQVLGQRARKFHYAVVEERRTHFERVRQIGRAHV